MRAEDLFATEERKAHASFQRKREEYATVPSRYQGCTLQLDQPTASQESIILVLEALLQGELCKENNPLRPGQGLYIHGPVGTGKTHLLAAYANALYDLFSVEEIRRKSLIDKSIKKIFKTARDNTFPEIVKEYQLFQERIRIDSYSQSHIKELGNVRANMTSINEDIYQKKSAEIIHLPSVLLEVGVSTLHRTVEREYPYSTSDLVFLGFEELLRLYEADQNMLDDVVAAPIVCIDDIHPKNEENRAKIIQEVLERRYDEGRGATFVTSNLSPQDLVSVGAYNEKIAERIISRCAEMFYIVDTADAQDYRTMVGDRRKENLLRLIAERRRTRNE